MAIIKTMGECIAIERNGKTTTTKLPDVINNVEEAVAKKAADTVLVFIGEPKKVPGIQIVAGEKTATKTQSTAVLKIVDEWLNKLSSTIYHSDGHKAAEDAGILAIMPPQAADIDDEYTKMVIPAITKWLNTAKYKVATVATPPPEDEDKKPDNSKPKGGKKPEDGKKATPALTEADLEDATHALRYRLANTPGYVPASFDPKPYVELFKKLNPDKK